MLLKFRHGEDGAVVTLVRRSVAKRDKDHRRKGNFHPLHNIGPADDIDAEKLLLSWRLLHGVLGWIETCWPAAVVS